MLINCFTAKGKTVVAIAPSAPIANLLANLRAAAGGSGIAGLAQTLANQQQLQTQQISASIGQQEAANQQLAAQGAANVQTMEAQAQMNVLRGEAQRQGQERQRTIKDTVENELREHFNKQYGANVVLFYTTSLYGSSKSTSQYEQLNRFINYIGDTDGSHLMRMKQPHSSKILEWLDERGISKYKFIYKKTLGFIRKLVFREERWGIG